MWKLSLKLFAFSIKETKQSAVGEALSGKSSAACTINKKTLSFKFCVPLFQIIGYSLE